MIFERNFLLLLCQFWLLSALVFLETTQSVYRVKTFESARGHRLINLNLDLAKCLLILKHKKHQSGKLLAIATYKEAAGFIQNPTTSRGIVHSIFQYHVFC